MMKKELLLEGMKCDGCVATVKEKFSAIAGVEEVIVDLEEKNSNGQNEPRHFRNDFQ